MDLNLVLLPALVLGAAFGAFRVVRLVGWRGKGWLATYAALGLLGALSLITEWRHGGLVTLGAWMALLVGPALANVQLRRSTERGDHDRALFWSRVGSILHPLDGTREVHAILRAVRLADAGDSDEWQDILRKVEASKSPVAVNARLQRLQLTGQWSELRAWLEGLDPKVRDGNSALVTNWVRAAGEQGEPEVMLQRYAHAIALPGVHQVRPILETVQLETAAFTGQLETGSASCATPTSAPSCRRCGAPWPSPRPAAQTNRRLSCTTSPARPGPWYGGRPSAGSPASRPRWSPPSSRTAPGRS